MSAEDQCEQYEQTGPDRSMGQYTRFTDLYEHDVTVKHSSLAEQEACWIFVGLDDQQKAELVAAGLDTRMFTTGAHLCRAMAAEVRDALDRFLTESADPDECGPASTTEHQG